MPIASKKKMVRKDLQWMDDLIKMHNFYGLYSGGIAIVKYLIQADNKPAAESKLNELWEQESSWMGNDDLEYLLENDFIRVDHEQKGERLLVLTDEAYQAFKSKEPFGVKLYEDHVDKLKDFKMDDFSELELFYYSLSQTTRETELKDGVEALRIRQLTEQQQIAFWKAVHHFLNHFDAPYTTGGDDDTLFNTTESLITLGLLENISADASNENAAENNGWFLSRKVVATLFYGHDEIINYKAISKVATIIKSNSIKPCELFYAKETQKEVDHLRRMLSPEGYDRARKILIRQNNNPAIISLLWGPPGTGKTEIVKQLSRESGRDIILFDVSKTTASAWGATERLYKTLFRDYAYIAAVCSLPPILLMNEADAILCKRLQCIEHAIDKGENNVSNILLQEFEDLNGILLATTNLVDILDEAFDRRFLFKTEIGMPDQAAREHIWKSKIPEFQECEVKKLAEQFTMSGGQINNVATKRKLAELYFEGDRGLAFTQDLCEKELSVSRRNGRSKNIKIGF